MKYKKIVSVVLAFALLFSITSCGSAPAEEKADNGSAAAVNNKTENNVTEEKDEDVTVKEEPKEGTFVDKDGTVRQVNTFDSEDGWVTFVVNAEVEGYDVTELPIVSVVPNHYDSAELQRLVEAMAVGNTVYGYTETLTKEELKNIRKEFEQLVVSYTNRTADGAINKTDEELAEAIAGWQAYIDAIDADLVDAPDELPYTEPVYEYGPESRYDEGKTYLRWYYGGKNMFRAFYLEDGRLMDIYAYDTTRTDTFEYNGEQVSSTVNFNVIYTAVNNQRNGSFGGTYTQKTPFTEEEKEQATKEVLQLVEDMGMGDWKLVGVAGGDIVEGREKFGCSLAFYFRPAYYDVPVGGASGSLWAYSTDKHTDVHAFSESSYMHISYSNGTVLEIGVSNDVDTVSETEPKALMPYDEALEVIYGYAANKWGFEHIYSISPYEQVKDENYSYNLYINKISLEYIRTVSGDNPDHYDLIPVWIVYGHPNVVNCYIGNTVIEGVSTKPGYNGNAESSLQPLMIINAYDGTLINSTMLTY